MAFFLIRHSDNCRVLWLGWRERRVGGGYESMDNGVCMCIGAIKMPNQRPTSIDFHAFFCVSVYASGFSSAHVSIISRIETVHTESTRFGFVRCASENVMRHWCSIRVRMIKNTRR